MSLMASPTAPSRTAWMPLETSGRAVTAARIVAPKITPLMPRLSASSFPDRSSPTPASKVTAEASTTRRVPPGWTSSRRSSRPERLFHLGEIHSWGKLAWGRYLRVPATRCCWSERSEYANADVAAGVVLGRSGTLTGRVDNHFRLLAKLRPCRALRAPGDFRRRTGQAPHHSDYPLAQHAPTTPTKASASAAMTSRLHAT